MLRIGILLSLSREHHTSLVLAAHFAQEVQLIRLAVDALDSESVTRILVEHAELCTLACEPCLLKPTVRLRRFGDLLAAHLRYKECVLFPQLQSHPSMTSAGIINPDPFKEVK